MWLENLELRGEVGRTSPEWAVTYNRLLTE